MTGFINEIHYYFLSIIHYDAFWKFVITVFPIIVFIEGPFYIVMIASILRAALDETFSSKSEPGYHPCVTCVLTCYSEGEGILDTLNTMVEQVYPGRIEILIIIDSADTNINTVIPAENFIKNFKNTPLRTVRLIKKKTRGGHSSSLNLGLKLAEGEILLSIDGDTSCDNTVVASIAQNYVDPNVVGVAGALRARNGKLNLITRLQSIEYMVGIHLSRIGLSYLNVLNNLSGAFNSYRKTFLAKIGGWKAGSAEDLDLTTRIQSYFSKHPNLKLLHDHHAIAHTDVPETIWSLMMQRLRWDGDLYYVYCSRHWRVMRPKFLGWKGFIAKVWYGLLLQTIFPFVITTSIIFSFIRYPIAFTLSFLALNYIYYLIVTVVLFTFYILLASERKKYDLGYVLFLPIVPIYRILMSFWSAIAILCEIILKSHRDTSMSPWWINRKID